MKTRRFNNLNDCKRYVASVINRMESGDVDPNLGSKLGYLVTILVKILEQTDLEKRLERIEKQMGL